MANDQITFYCPLAVCCDENGCAEPVKLSNRYLVRNEEKIRAALRAELQEGENMADYLDPPLSNKVSSVEWDIASIGRSAYGKITCDLLDPLTVEEQEELADWILGQNSDGFGEGFEQRPVETSDGELYVSFWHSGNDYYVLPEDEFRARILDQPLVIREQAWLESAPAYDDGSVEAEVCREACRVWGLRGCPDWQEYNNLAQWLGEEAYQAAAVEIEEQSYGGIGGMS